MNRIILASASPRRRELLKKAGVDFTVIPGTEEERITADTPREIVKELSCAKAYHVAARQKDCSEGTLIIGADTIVVFEGKILGKPSGEEDAVNTLLALQGNTHQVYTGVTVLRKKKDWKAYSFSECTDVTFYPVTEEEIRAYVQTKEPMDKAGSYGIQGGFGIYVKEIKGDYNNVVGLPVARLFYEMKKLGINLRSNGMM